MDLQTIAAVYCPIGQTCHLAAPSLSCSLLFRLFTWAIFRPSLKPSQHGRFLLAEEHFFAHIAKVCRTVQRFYWHQALIVSPESWFETCSILELRNGNCHCQPQKR